MDLEAEQKPFAMGNRSLLAVGLQGWAKLRSAATFLLSVCFKTANSLFTGRNYSDHFCRGCVVTFCKQFEARQRCGIRV